MPITPLDRDSAADPFDEADFELPDGKTMPERIRQFIAGLAQEVDNKYRVARRLRQRRRTSGGERGGGGARDGGGADR